MQTAYDGLVELHEFAAGLTTTVQLATHGYHFAAIETLVDGYRFVRHPSPSRSESWI